MTQPTWSAPVRYAETDQQGVVFHAHYLAYCDEAMGAFLAAASPPAGEGATWLAERLQLVTSSLTWSAPARWGEEVEVDARCREIGRTSLAVEFDIRVGQRLCCRVSTTYVLVGPDRRPAPLPERWRAALAARPAPGAGSSHPPGA